jgi:voltage-gated potassium channel
MENKSNRSEPKQPIYTPITTADEERPTTPLRAKIHDIIFLADTPSGKTFDVALLILIVLSILIVMLDSVEEISSQYGLIFYALEWLFTVLFTAEYILRLSAVRKPSRYALSFFGIVDLLAVVPTYLSLFFAGAQTLLIIRVLRLLRIFRVFKLTRFMGEAQMLTVAMKASRHKIIIFLGVVMSLVLILGTLVYLIEGPSRGFTSIPRSVYWAIVTMTTVGYGDIAPQTVAGQTIAAFMMILGYGIIAVPTGIMTVEIAQARGGDAGEPQITTCHCGLDDHTDDALFCRHCGNKLQK